MNPAPEGAGQVSVAHGGEALPGKGRALAVSHSSRGRKCATRSDAGTEYRNVCLANDKLCRVTRQAFPTCARNCRNETNNSRMASCHSYEIRSASHCFPAAHSSDFFVTKVQQSSAVQNSTHFLQSKNCEVSACVQYRRSPL